MSQKSLSFPGLDYSGPDLMGDLPGILQALASNRAGSARPTDVQAGELWIQIVSATSWLLNLWDGAQDVLVATVNPSAHTISFAVSYATASGHADTADHASLADVAANANALGGMSEADIVAAARTGVAKTAEETAYTKQQRATPVVLAGQGGTLYLNAPDHQSVEITATAALTLGAPTNAVKGDTILMCLYAATALALAFASCFKGNADITSLDTAFTAGKHLYLNFYCTDGTNWMLFGRALEA